MSGFDPTTCELRGDLITCCGFQTSPNNPQAPKHSAKHIYLLCHMCMMFWKRLGVCRGRSMTESIYGCFLILGALYHFPYTPLNVSKALYRSNTANIHAFGCTWVLGDVLGWRGSHNMWPSLLEVWRSSDRIPQRIVVFCSKKINKKSDRRSDHGFGEVSTRAVQIRGQI